MNVVIFINIFLLCLGSKRNVDIFLKIIVSGRNSMSVSTWVFQKILSITLRSLHSDRINTDIDSQYLDIVNVGLLLVFS